MSDKVECPKCLWEGEKCLAHLCQDEKTYFLQCPVCGELLEDLDWRPDGISAKPFGCVAQKQRE